MYLVVCTLTTIGTTVLSYQMSPETRLLERFSNDLYPNYWYFSFILCFCARRSILSYTDNDSSAESDRQEFPHSGKRDLGIEMSSDSDTDDVASTRYVYGSLQLPDRFLWNVQNGVAATEKNLTDARLVDTTI